MMCHLQGVSTSPVSSLLTVFLSCQSAFYNEKNYKKKILNHTELGKTEAEEFR